jgi:flavin-dependent dehydrogenase
MSAKREVHIIGGGLAGLSLGLALARRRVPTSITEAGEFPRHRVCGEFIAGLNTADARTLGIEPMLADALAHRTVQWWHGARLVATQTLRQPALGISRHTLDQRLAEAFVEAGGNLTVNARAEVNGQQEGTVWATGRRPSRSDWVGIKVHVQRLNLESDLELHLGQSSYVGLSRIEGDRVNVCGLFHRSKISPGVGGNRMIPALRRSGLGVLATRLEKAAFEPGSSVSVAGISFDRDTPHDSTLRIGDSIRAIPPFTGHGMALAFLSAAAAVGPLCSWAQKDACWAEVVTSIQQTISSRTRRRFLAARAIHPWLLWRGRQPILALAQRGGVLPLSLITRFLHT